MTIESPGQTKWCLFQTLTVAEWTEMAVRNGCPALAMTNWFDHRYYI